MSKQLWVVVVTAALCVTAIPVQPWGGRAEATHLPPNILLIVTDDQPVGTLGVMPKTKRLFVKQGRPYPRGFVTTPLCCPSRASIFTGRYMHNHGVLNNGSAGAGSFDHDTTIQRHLHESGYTTAVAGKFIHGWPIEEAPPHFDRWAVVKNGGGHYDYKANVDGRVKMVPRYSTYFIRDRAIRILRDMEADDARPWFLTVATKAPHAPFVPPSKYRGAPVPRWRPTPSAREKHRGDKPPWIRSRSASLERARRTRRRQLRMLMAVDDMVGRLFSELSALNENRRTLAIFISDNGFLYRDHGVMSKRYPYTRSIRVPFMLRWPGRVARGQVDRRWAANIDIAPTIADVAGLQVGPPMDGKSLFGPTRDHLFFEYHRDIHYTFIPSWASIRTGRYHYIEYYDDSDNVIFREHYRLAKDPWQLRNVLRDGDPSNNPPVDRLSAIVRRHRGCAGGSCP